MTGTELAMRIAYFIGGMLFVLFGGNVLGDAIRVHKGEAPRHPVTYRAMSRYPVKDFGKHWKKRGSNLMVVLIGAVLIVLGIGGMLKGATGAGL